MSQSNNTYDVYLPKIKQQLLSEIICRKMEIILEDIFIFFNRYRYWFINNDEMIFDSETGLLWQAKLSNNIRYKLSNSKNKSNLLEATPTNEIQLGGINEWFCPSNNEIEEIFTNNFPLFSFMSEKRHWLITDGCIDLAEKINGQLNKEFLKIDPNNSGYIFGRYQLVNKEYDLWEILEKFINLEWEYKPYGNSDIENLNEFYERVQLVTLLYQELCNNLNSFVLDSWSSIDNISTRLPVINTPEFTDEKKGLWEFYVPPSQQEKFNKIQSETFIRGRNPALDIQHATVAIDFGTSSTVVAIRQNGRDELLRIGIQEKDLDKAINAEQFENPTILEFLDLNEFQSSWQSEAYRPLVNWDHVHCSHEAKASLNNNKEADNKVISSIFPRLKQWALRDAQQTKIVITDQQGIEYTVQPLTEYNPVKGQAIQINQDYPELDPIELYAWFLGMNINWRGRGIFLDYYMTFPVAYPNEVKDKILASFRRGLMRSLPESLIADEQFNQFSVQKWASEPAAYAAAALEKLNIEPTEQGVAYAVFDFGGGTTDFDYGIYREPNEQEEDLYDHVIEHFGASGDKFLGGENLLENLAYLVFKDNQDICRKQKVSFTKPLDAEKFIGHEQLIDDSQMAYTNTSLLMAALRPFLEKGQFADGFAGALDIKLLNRQNEVVNCQFTVKQDELLSYLKCRIYQGFVNFFVELKQAFTTQHQALPKIIHILLAGNASRSKLVKELLVGIEKKDQNQTTRLNLSTIFGQDIPEFKIHYPLDADLKHHDVITAKTGVALGLLRLCPGEGLKVINHAKTNDDANSPFQFYVGRQKRGVFEVMIKRGDAYHQWQQIGAVSEDGIFLLLYSSLAQALTDEGMKRGATGLFDQRIRFAGNTAGQKVFARILAPSEIELCSASDLDEIQVTGGNNLQQIKLS